MSSQGMDPSSMFLEAIEDATGARWWFWLMLLSFAILVSVLTDEPNAIAVALAALAFALLANYTAPGGDA